MTGSGVLALLIGLAVIALPLATYYRPFSAGVLGVVALTGAALYFFGWGRSAMTETTAAVFAVGAFLLAGLLAMVRAAQEIRDAVEARDEN